MLENKLKQLLADCELAHRDLAAQAAQAGEYTALDQITRSARVITELRSSIGTSNQKLKPIQATPNTPQHKLGSPFEPMPRGKSKPGRAKERPKQTNYPVFRFDDGQLIRTGWSKSQRAEYEHKAPVRLVELVCDALNRETKKDASSPIPSDQLLPVIDPHTGHAYPSYQVYVVLGWLKNERMIQQVGRQGHKVQEKLGTSVVKRLQTLA